MNIVLILDAVLFRVFLTKGLWAMLLTQTSSITCESHAYACLSKNMNFVIFNLLKQGLKITMNSFL